MLGHIVSLMRNVVVTGSHGKTTTTSIISSIFSYAKLDIDKYVEIDERLFRPHEVPLLLGDSSKAKKILGWEPEYNMEKMAKEMYRQDWHHQEKILRANYGYPDPMSFPSK